MSKNVHQILYSFRRCPYAMRARMALQYAQIPYEHREITLRNKPQHMLEISPKGTVPILILTNGNVIDESLEIMHWALAQNDPEKWHPKTRQETIQDLIKNNDTVFKPLLDHYKYTPRTLGPDKKSSGLNARNTAIKTLNTLNENIAKNGNLIKKETSLADIAIFPFIRQFAHVDRDWFATLPLSHLQNWLHTYKQSPLFTKIMKKHDLWNENH